jgi:peptide chain release factor 1
MEPLLGKLASVEARFQEIERLMARPEVAMDYAQIQTLAKERASLEELVSMYRGYCKALKERQDALAILKEGAEAGMTSLASQELEILNGRLEELGQRLRLAILPRDPNDDKDVIVEVREGVGGKEAALFAADLYRMYTRYAVLRNWEIEALNSSPSGLGGFKEIVFEVRGKGAFSRLKHERGAHRVQRVPVTEASGRIHTSTATVAVLPEADDVDVRVNQDDLRIDIFHAGGHGGQNVNKVATAVRIVHIPTGTSAVCQDERSQFKNKQKAMAILRARLYEAEQQKQESEITEARRSQVGSGDRSEKIRTYNVPQDRITDHRIGVTFHNLHRVLDGDIDPIIDALAAREQENLLEKAQA